MPVSLRLRERLFTGSIEYYPAERRIAIYDRKSGDIRFPDGTWFGFDWWTSGASGKRASIIDFHFIEVPESDKSEALDHSFRFDGTEVHHRSTGRSIAAYSQTSSLTEWMVICRERTFTAKPSRGYFLTTTRLFENDTFIGQLTDFSCFPLFPSFMKATFAIDLPIADMVFLTHLAFQYWTEAELASMPSFYTVNPG